MRSDLRRHYEDVILVKLGEGTFEVQPRGARSAVKTDGQC